MLSILWAVLFPSILQILCWQLGWLCFCSLLACIWIQISSRCVDRHINTRARSCTSPWSVVLLSLAKSVSSPLTILALTTARRKPKCAAHRTNSTCLVPRAAPASSGLLDSTSGRAFGICVAEHLQSRVCHHPSELLGGVVTWKIVCLSQKMEKYFLSTSLKYWLNLSCSAVIVRES